VKIRGIVDLRKLQNEVNRAFEKLNESVFGNYKRPSVNISQNDEDVMINAEMPGLSKEEVILKFHNQGLEIIGEKKGKKIKKNEKGYSEISSYKGYKAFIGLPSNVNIDKVEARYDKDKLKIKIPKMKTRLGKSIEVN
jgi:HSP20 family protein